MRLGKCKAQQYRTAMSILEFSNVINDDEDEELVAPMAYLCDLLLAIQHDVSHLLNSPKHAAKDLAHGSNCSH